jgi:hypothetical protein
MTMVDEGAAGARHAGAPGLDRGTHADAVPCAARPGSGRVHLDGPCQCFFGGPPPVFLDARYLDARVATVR